MSLFAAPHEPRGAVELLAAVAFVVQAVVVGAAVHAAFGVWGVVVAMAIEVAAVYGLVVGLPRWLEPGDPSEALDQEERELMGQILEFGDTVVREVMVPRPDMVAVPEHLRVADVMEVVLLNGYSRIPVYRSGLDDIAGLVYAKDLMRAERDGQAAVSVGTLVRPAKHVPETKRIPELLDEMQRDQFHMAVVVDEYGATAGLVTLEDLIEELVGEIVDEFDKEEPMIEPLPGGLVRVNARMNVGEVNDLVHAELPEGDWDTIGGLVFHLLGHIPVEGETVEADGHELRAEQVQGRRIGRVRIAPPRPDEAGPVRHGQ